MPEKKVDCLMCGGSFSATADTLDEVVHLVECHLKDMERYHEPLHEKKTRGAYPHGKKEILASRWFSWDILGLVPFNALSEDCAALSSIGSSSAGGLSVRTGEPRRERLRRVARLRRREAITVPARS
jgi:hypothetical protein